MTKEVYRKPHGTHEGDRDGYERGAPPLSKTDREFLESADPKADRRIYLGAERCIAQRQRVLGE